MAAHRRSGKTFATVNDLIRTALTCPLPRPRVYYIAPTYTQAKRIAWDYAKHFSRPIPGMKINEGELRIDYPNEGRLQLLGADNPDGARGIYADGVALDENAFMSPAMWQQIIRPALSDRKGRAIFISSVNGPNAFFDLYQMAADDPDWQRWLLKASETGIIDQDELESLRREMTEEDYAQEYECDFSVAIKGALFGKQMQELEEAGRLTTIPRDPGLQVQTAWDLGVSDPAAIWVFQQAGHETRWIDYIENTGVGLEYYINELDKRGYLNNGKPAIWPPDGAVREFGANGKSRQQIAAGLGMKTTLLPASREGDQVQALRQLLPKSVFDRQKCKPGIDAISQARREWNDKRKIFGASLLHDWASHGTKAAMYAALGIRPFKPGKMPIDAYDRNVRAQRRASSGASSAWAS